MIIIKSTIDKRNKNRYHSTITFIFIIENNPKEAHYELLLFSEILQSIGLERVRKI